MIKFFNRIRQSLLSNYKFSKYLIYAMGEIILVVIGILIALQINNANEARKLEKIELGYLNRLLIDLAKDQKLWESTIEQKNEQLRSIRRIQNIAFYQPDSMAAILDQIPSALLWNDLNPHQTTFNEMLSGGNLNIIRNDSIKIKLLELNDAYKSEINRVNTFKIEQTNTMEAFRAKVSFKNVILMSGNRESFKLAEMETINDEVSKDFKLLLNDKKFINNLIGLGYNYNNQLSSIKDLKTRTEQLTALIQAEVNHRVNN